MKLDLSFNNSDVNTLKNAYLKLLEELKKEVIIEDFEVYTRGPLNNQVVISIVKSNHFLDKTNNII
jgi:hypothetical protein